MEAVPRLPMISFQLKVSPEPTTFGPKLKQYIRDFYNEDPESYTNEIHQLESLRAMVVRPPIDMASCLLLKKYYCQLHFLQSRFPMGKDGAAAATFTWKDTYANMVYSMDSIRFEIISILYNIGSMHTQLGARTERTSPDGMKMACAHFQCAAWAFDHLKNSYPQPSGVDLAPELMTFMQQLCLAQAQECILEKSMLDNRKPTIVAKVARQIVDYFTLALTTLEQGGSDDGTISDTVGTKIYKGWKRYVKFKKAYHLAVTYLYQGLAAEEQRKMGERVAFYNAACASLVEAYSIYNSSKGSMGITGAFEEKTAVEEALVFTNDVIEGKRKAAKNENEFIYHEEVPEKEVLPAVKGASLVKGISFSINDPEVSGPDIFARLVPMKVHEASSLYSEEKAKILRSIGAKIEEKDQHLNTYLASLKLEHMSLWDPDVQSTDWERLPLPDELVERCAALNAKQHIIQELVDIMAKLSETSQDVETILKEIKKLLLDEEVKEKQYQSAVGKRPPSIVATDLTREAKKYEEAHNKASESNHALHKAVTMHVKNLKVLAQPLAELLTHVPSPGSRLSEQNSDKSPSAIELDRMHTNELKHILNKVDEMRRQRSDLHTKLRESIAQDDLTRLLVTATTDSGSLDRLFADQLSKHQSLVNLIEQNLTAQETILSALTDAYAQTANVRKSVEETLKRRELVISSLIASYDAYEDLLSKSSKGLEFYRKLEINVTKLLQRVKSTCTVQEEEREQILAQDNKNSQDKVETTVTYPYDYNSAHTRTNSGLKLKDYLNSRTESIQSHPSQYYDMYKSQARTVHTDETTKLYPTAETMEKNYYQISRTVSGSIMTTSDATSTIPKSAHYYPTSYTDYKTTMPYSYAAATPYNEASSIDPAGIPTCMSSHTSDRVSPYQQIPQPTTGKADGMMPQCQVHNSFASNGQPYPSVAITSQEKYTVNPRSQYIPTTANYGTYQPTADYSGYNTQYPSTLDRSSAVPKTDSREVAQPHTPNAFGSAPQPGTLDTMGQPYATGQQQYLQTPQRKILCQDASQSGSREHTLQPTDPSQIKSYQSISHANQTEIPASQIYHGVSSYPNPDGADLRTQQAVIGQNLSGAVTSPNPVQYLQGQYGTVPPSMHSTTSTNALSNPIGEITPSCSSNTQVSSNTVIQYSQQDGGDGVKQNFIEKSHLPYGSQMPIDNTTLSYAGTYQNLQQNMPGPYTYVNCPSTTPEMIQSHAKASAIAQTSYMPPYQQYPQQNDFAAYTSQGYNYMQTQNQMPNQITNQMTNQMANTIADPYKVQEEYQGYPNTQAQTCQYPVENSQVSQSASNGTYYPQDYSARYTNASHDSAVSQTPSSHYLNQVHSPNSNTDTYYTNQYGLQTQGQGSTPGKPDNYTNYNQTYMQAVNNGTSTTNANPMKSTSKSDEQSAVDLLSDLDMDITINHAPLVPEVRPLNKSELPEEAVSNSVTDSGSTEQEIEKESTTAPTETTQGKSTTSADDKTDTENLQIVWDTWYNDVRPKKDPLGEPAALQKLITEVEKYEKFVDSLLVKTLSGATNLDIKWKEVQDFEVRESSKQSCTVALAHSSENRVMECIPYDATRVQVSVSDVPNYINASHVMEITQWIPTAFIITQAPLPDKLDIFWSMIWEQESEVIACLVSDAQLNAEPYWPINEENRLTIGNFTITLKKKVNHMSYVQRILSVYNSKKDSERTVVHMQFLTWPSNGFPSSPGALLAFSSDVMTEQALRRCSPKPVVVHCLDGGSLSSLFLIAAATVCHIRAGCGIVDVPLVFKGLVKCRKQVVNKESMLFAYRLVLYHAQDSLMKRGILSSSRSTFENFEGLKGQREKAGKKMHHPSDDFIHNLSAAVHRPDTEQGRKAMGSNSASPTPTSKSISKSKSDKSSDGIIDPLSQLDPLWSIRR